MQINATQALQNTSATSATASSQSAASFAMLLAAAQQKQDDNAAATTAADTVAAMDSAGSGAGTVTGSIAETGAKSAAEQLAEYAAKSVAERIRDAVLKDMGLTEEDLAAMDPEKRAAIEEEIARRVKAMLTGQRDGEQPQADRVSGLASGLELA